MKYLPIALVIPITYIGHFLHLNWLMIVDIENNALVFEGIVHFLIAVLTKCLPVYCSHIWSLFFM